MKLKPPYSEDSLVDLMANEGIFAPYDKWISTVLAGIHELLENNPSRYKTYGPVWYHIKAILNANGYNYGDDFEGDIGRLYSSDHFALVAGVLISNGRVQSGMSESNLCQLIDEDGEVFEFALEDPDMQNLIFERTAF